MSKYAEDIAEIKTDVKHLVKGQEKINASQAKQWNQINKNFSAIEVLKARLKSLGQIKVAKISARAYVLGAVIAGGAAIVGGLVSSWL